MNNENNGEVTQNIKSVLLNSKKGLKRINSRVNPKHIIITYYESTLRAFLKLFIVFEDLDVGLKETRTMIWMKSLDRTTFMLH